MKNFSKRAIKKIKYKYGKMLEHKNCIDCCFYDTEYNCVCMNSEKWYCCMYESESVTGIQETSRYAAYEKKYKKYHSRYKKKQRKKKDISII